MAKSRRPKNIAHGEFFERAIEHGWEITSRGWPTFFVQRGERVVAVEVVSSKGRRLREDKQRVVQALLAAGIECYLWSPDGGFTSLAESGSLTTPLGERGLGSFSSPKGEGSGERGEAAPFETPPTAAPSRDGTAEKREAVDRVWGCYVRLMEPAATIAGEEERKIIRNALKVASEEECCEAIEGCRASDYHMGVNERRRKYNTLSHILRGKRGKRTTREQIDFMRDLRSKAVESGGSLTSSVDPAVVAQKKDDVRRGHALQGDAAAVRRAGESEAWLKRHGIVTRRREDGYPVWADGGNS